MRHLRYGPIALLLVLYWPISLTSQRRSESPTDLIVRVNYDNDRPVGQMIRVQVLGQANSMIAERTTDDRGQATFTLFPGAYKLKVFGVEVEETTSDQSFEIISGEVSHFETINVKRKATKDENSSTQGSVSAAELNVPDKARSEFEKGMSAIANKDYGEANKRLTKAVEIYPHYGEAINSLGVVAMNTGKPDEGKQFFEQAIQADADCAPAYTNRAKVLMSEKKLAEAESSLTKSISLNPLNPEALSLFAYLELSLGKLDPVIQAAQKVHSLPHERFAMVHLLAATALTRKSQNSEAIREYKLFIQESPQSPSVERVRAAIASLEKVVR